MLRAGHGVVLIVCALLAIGVVMVTSAGLTIDAGRSISLPQILLGRPALLAALAVGALLVGLICSAGMFYMGKAFKKPSVDEK